MDRPQQLVVVGNGMVAHRFIELMVDLDQRRDWQITVIGEESRPAYDRVNLTAFFAGRSAAELSLVKPDFYAGHGIEALISEKVTAIDRGARTVTCASGRQLPYDRLVLATGSYPFVPPVPGRDAPGAFVYRTIDDLEAIRDYAAGAKVGAVVGGGLLGLEAANALRQLGLATHVIEFGNRLMSIQLDDAGGSLLRRKIEALGVAVRTGSSTSAVCAEEGRVRALRFADGSELVTDIVVFSAGIRPRDELARSSALGIGERGGIVIDERCRTEDPAIFAIGECALYRNRIFGLVAPGYHMARVAAEAISGRGETTFTGFDMSTKLKLMGVDVASFGDAQAQTPQAQVVVYSDSAAGVYRKLVLSPDRSLVIGGILVGDAALYGELTQLMLNRIVLAPHPESLILPASQGAAPGRGPGSLPDSATICSCHNVTKGTICSAIREQGCSDAPAITACTRAGSGCGSCVPLLKDLLRSELTRAGVAISKDICEHFAHSRQEIYHLVRLHGIHDFATLLDRHGRGGGCEICKPAVASILASAWNEHILDRRHVALQDSNDRFLANIQRDGSYSVIPRIPGGEITPAGLIAIGAVALRFGLYCKITGGQRIDLLGARVEQLPAIWNDLIAAGFESGHAYGKALRTVKSCVGSTWCRYGVQDSVGLAIRLEHRYKGLRSPHKLKSAVSGCARECAEAQSKDFGIIATDKGYNLYLCGNGGMKPQHALLFATDLDETTLVRYLDRFLMFYIRTADRLERTATWFNKLDGGMDYLRQVIMEDSLGLAAELEAEMAAVVGSYQDEWQGAVRDPEKRQQFRAFVNSDVSDPSLVTIPERGQRRPATWTEKAPRLGTPG